jgi:hypothetical protein
MAFCCMGFLLCGGYHLFYQNQIANLVIIIDLHAIFVCCVKIGLALPVISNFISFGYKWDVKEHVACVCCHAWRGFNSLTPKSVPV